MTSTGSPQNPRLQPPPDTALGRFMEASLNWIEKRFSNSMKLKARLIKSAGGKQHQPTWRLRLHSPTLGREWVIVERGYGLDNLMR